MGGYEHFTAQLDLFLKRWYLNKALKGFIAFLVLFAAVAVLTGLVQFFAFLDRGWRAALFYGGLAVSAAGFGCWVLWPLLQAYGRAARMTRLQAAHYLAEHFPGASDRLYNVLELKETEGTDYAGSPQILQAAIEQITSGFLLYKFEKAVKFRNVLPWLYSLAAVLVVVWAAVGFEPGLVDSTAQVVRYNEEFERVFPFTVSVTNSALQTGYEEDFTLQVYTEGSKLPEKIYLCQNGRVLPLVRLDANRFTYTFKKVRENEVFTLKTGKYESPEYTLTVNRKPVMSGMRAVLRYPAYTGKKVEVVDNSLDLTVLYGTRIEWELNIDYARQLSVWVQEETALKVDAVSRPVFRFGVQAFKDFTYFLVPEGFASAMGNTRADTLSFAVKTVPDAYPHIQTTLYSDSLYPLQKYYQGFISDDYGFHSLVFEARCVNASTGRSWEKYDTLDIDLRKKEQMFSFRVDLSQFALQPGDELSYGFSLSDNDAFYPYKTVYSPMETYRKMSVEEVKEELKQTASGLDQSFSLSLQQNRSFDEDLQKLVEDLLSKQQFSWEDLQKVEMLMEQQKQLRERYEQLNDELERKRALENEAGLENEELLEKQRELQELLQQLLDDKTLEKLAELQQLMERQESQDKVMDKLEDLKINNEQLAKDLEQNMELYRQMEFELRMESISKDIERLKSMSEDLKKQLENLTDKMLEKLKDSLLEQNRQLGSEMEKLANSLRDLESLNEKLEKPNNFSMPDSLLNSLKEDVENTMDAMQQGKSKQAKEKHDKTDGDLNALGMDIMGQFSSIMEDNAAEDADFIRLLLKSVLRVSVEQEEVMVNLGKTNINDPRYPDFIRRQSSLNMEIDFVCDSVRAIARRQPQVAVGTRQILRDLEKNSRESLEYLLGMHNVIYQRYSTTNSWALTRQQYAMTGLNDLALMLSESLDHMKEKAGMPGGSSKSKKKSKGKPQMSCPNPGQNGMQQRFPQLSEKKQGKDGKDGKKLQEMQKALNAQLEALKKMLEERAKKEAQNGKEGGEKQAAKQGSASGSGGEIISDEQVSEQFARAAAQQEKIRRMLQDKMAREKDPQANGLYNSVLGEMERTERDLVNKILTQDMLMRQKKIETRLLEAENAELKRDKDEKRESKQGRDFAVPKLDSLDLNEKERGVSREFLLRQTPELKPFYKERVEEYFK